MEGLKSGFIQELTLFDYHLSNLPFHLCLFLDLSHLNLCRRFLCHDYQYFQHSQVVDRRRSNCRIPWVRVGLFCYMSRRWWILLYRLEDVCYLNFFGKGLFSFKAASQNGLLMYLILDCGTHRRPCLRSQWFSCELSLRKRKSQEEWFLGMITMNIKMIHVKNSPSDPKAILRTFIAEDTLSCCKIRSWIRKRVFSKSKKSCYNRND